MNKQFILSNFILICILYIMYSFVNQICDFYKEEKERIVEMATTSLQKALDTDFSNRVKVLDKTFVVGKSRLAHPDSSTLKSDTQEIKIPFNTEKTPDEKLKDFFQHILADKKPIDIHELDSLFQKELQAKGCPMETAIHLTDSLHQKSHSTQPILHSFTPLPENPFRISSTGISIRAYIKISPWNLLQQVPVLYWMEAFVGLLFSLYLGNVWRISRKKRALVVTTDDCPQDTIEKESATIRDGNIMQLSPSVRLRKKEKILEFKNQPVNLTSQQLNLLLTFLSAPEQTCSLEYLQQQNWPKEVVSEETIRKAVSRLKKSLAGIQPLSIELSNKGEYVLIIHEDSSLSIF